MRRLYDIVEQSPKALSYRYTQYSQPQEAGQRFRSRQLQFPMQPPTVLELRNLKLPGRKEQERLAKYDKNMLHYYERIQCPLPSLFPSCQPCDINYVLLPSVMGLVHFSIRAEFDDQISISPHSLSERAAQYRSLSLNSPPLICLRRLTVLCAAHHFL
jgi:hypothetical protein